VAQRRSRCSGQAAHRRGGDLPCLDLLVERARHVRLVHRAGLDDVDRDALRAEFLGQEAGEL
jgi:hypothetical protein